MNRVLSVFGLIAVMGVTEVPRSQAIVGLASANPALIVTGGVLIVAGGIVAAVPARDGYAHLARALLVGAPLVLAGLIVLPDSGTTAQFKSLTPRDLAEMHIDTNDVRLRDYQRDLSKLNQIAANIQDRVAQLPASSSDEAILRISEKEWKDYRSTLRPGTWSLVSQLAAKTASGLQ